MQLEVVTGDITRLANPVDAIVNAANAALCGGGGVDGAIHRAAGRELLALCRTLGRCETGDARLTPAFALGPATRFIIHAVGPVWDGGHRDERVKLASCYRTALALAAEAGARSIAFPCISTGVYRFPHDKAAEIAVATVRAHATAAAFDRIVFCCFDDADTLRYQRLLAG